MTHCPSDDRLRAFDRGAATDVEADAVADHLAGCAVCVARLDRLAVAVGAPSATPDLGPDGDAYRRAVAAAAGLVPGGPPLPRAGDLLRDYRLLELIGRGGMGAVFRAVHDRLGKEVAVKVLAGRRWADPAAAARFAREMRAAGRLAHPNIVQATDAGEAGGVPFLVMELVDGVTLSALVKRDGPRPAGEACGLVRQAAAGLGYAHRCGLVHRDVKPSNLIRAADGTVKVLDLGLALPVADPPAESDATAGGSSASGGSDLTSASHVVGTVGYMAPEQRRDAHGVDARADVYGLGATLWFLLTGDPPGGSAAAPPGGIPRAIWAKLLAPDPADRYPDMAALSAALEPYSVPPAVGRRRGVVAAVGVVAAAGAVATTIALRPPTTTPLPAPEPPPVAASVVLPTAPPPRAVPPPGAVQLSPHAAGALQLDWAAYLGVSAFVTTPAGLDLALVPPGELDLARNARFAVTRPYRIATTAVTRRQFAAFVRDTGHVTDVELRGNGEYQFYFIAPDGRSAGTRSQRGPGFNWRFPGYADPADDEPVTMVSWDDAAAFCRWLGAADGRAYRLPTEAEWQWATSAGEADDRLPTLSPLAPRPYPMRPAAANDGRMNAWGVCLGGRVTEWCRDWYGEIPPGRHVDYENTTPHVSGIRLTCGSSYALPRSPGARAGFLPQAGRSTIGFRVVCGVR